MIHSTHAILAAPYNYQHGDNRKVLKLFLSTECTHCKDALRSLISYLKKKPEISVKVCFYANNPKSRNTLYKLMAAKDLDQLLELFSLSERRLNERFEKDSELQTRFKNESDKYVLYAVDMKKEFAKHDVGYVPVWTIGENRIVGIPDNLHKLFDKIIVNTSE